MSLCLAVRWSASLVLLCWMVAATISLIPTSIISRLACVILKGEAVGIREKQQSLQCDTKGARFTFSDTFGHRSCSSLSVESTCCHNLDIMLVLPNTKPLSDEQRANAYPWCAMLVGVVCRKVVL